MKKKIILIIIIAGIIIFGSASIIHKHNKSMNSSSSIKKEITVSSKKDDSNLNSSVKDINVKKADVKMMEAKTSGVKEAVKKKDTEYNLNSILGYWIQNEGTNNVIYYHFFKTEAGQYGYKQVSLNPTNIEFQEFNQIGDRNDNSMVLNYTRMLNVVPMDLKKISDNQFKWTNTFENNSNFKRISEKEYLNILKKGMNATGNNTVMVGGVSNYVNLYFGRLMKPWPKNDYIIKNIKIDNEPFMIYTSKSLKESVLVNKLGQTYSYKDYKSSGKLVKSYGKTLNTID